MLRVMRSVAEEDRTMIVVTHEMGFAKEVSNHGVFLHKGCIEEQGNPKEVQARPQTERLQAFLSNSLKWPQVLLTVDCTGWRKYGT